MTQIIAAIDGSPLAQTVCNGAVWSAGTLNKPLLFIHALEKNTAADNANLSGAIGLGARGRLQNKLADLDSERAKYAYQQGKAMLDDACKQAKSRGITTVRGEQRHGELVETLQHYATQSTLIVLGRSGEDHPAGEKIIGKHLDNAISSLHSPLLITTETFSAPTSFMIAYDGRDTANRLIDFIAEHSLLKSLNAHLLYIGEENAKIKRSIENAVNILQTAGYNVTPSVINQPQESISQTLDDYARDKQIELIAMGAFGKKGFRRFFIGSNTLKIIAKSNFTVLIMK